MTQRDQDKTQQLEILNHVARALSESLQLEDVLNTALSEAMHALGVEHGGIYILDEETRKLNLKVEHQLTKEFVKENSDVELGHGCAGTAVVTKKMFSALGQSDKAVVCADAERLMGIDCLVAAPIIYKGRVLGVLELFAQTARRLTAAEADLLSSVLSHIAIAVENANAHETIRQALASSRMLLQATEAIASVLEVGEILARLTELASRSLGVNRVKILFYDEQKDELVLTAGRGDIPPVGTSYQLADMTKAQRHVFDTHKCSIVHYSPTEEPETILARNVVSELMTPLNYKNTILGIMLLDDPGIDRVFSVTDIELTEALSRHAAVAIANARAYSQQQEIAATLQKSFLQLQIPVVPGVETGAYYTSATTGALVGGDFYDVFVCHRKRLSIAIGDVSGKGIGATATAAAVKNTLHMLAMDECGPASVLSRTNDLISPQLAGSKFVTMTMIVLDPSSGHFLYGNAGHPPPLIYRRGAKSAAPMSVGNVPLGVTKKPIYRESTDMLAADDFIVLYTDGVIEARCDSELYGEERLIKAVDAAAGLEAQEIVGQVIDDVKKFSRDRLSDDIALLVVKRTP